MSCSKKGQTIQTFHGILASFGFGILAALIVAVISIFMPNYYTSKAKILPVGAEGGGKLGQLTAMAAAVGLGGGTGGGSDANFVDILKSRSVMVDLLKTEFKFQERPWRYGKEQVHQQTLYDYLGATNLDRALNGLGAILSVNKDSKTSIITVSAETKSPELSQQVVQRATEGLEAFVLGKARTSGTEKARFAEARLKESRAELAQVEEDFRRFQEVNRNYLTSPDPTVRLKGLRLENEYKLRQQLVVTIAMNLENALMEAKNDVPIVNVLDEANLPVDKSKPQRALLVMEALFGVTAACLGWRNREWIKARIDVSDGGSKTQDSAKESA